MKRTALTITFAAAAMLAAAATGSAQTMKAEIPFAFHSGSARMQAGAYSVVLSRSAGGREMLQIYSLDEHRSVIAGAISTSRPATPRESKAALSFACAEGHCALASVRDEMSNVYNFPVGKAGSGARIATVLLRPDRAE